MNDLAVVSNLTNADRQKFLGGSDIAALYGLSKWATPLSVYMDKVVGKQPEDPAKAKVFARGKRLEPVVIGMCVEEFGLVVTNTNQRYNYGPHPFMSCEIDFEFEVTEELQAMFPPLQLVPTGSIQNADVKTVHPFVAKDWGEAQTDEVPAYYGAQFMWGLGVTGRDVCMCAALFGADDLVIYFVFRDDEVIAEMRQRAMNFWEKHVIAQVPPEPVNMDDFHRLYLKRNGQPVEIDSMTETMLAEMKADKDRMKVLEAKIEEKEYQIAMRIRHAFDIIDPAVDPKPEKLELIVGGKPVATWNRTRGSHLDQKSLAVDHPDIKLKYSKEHFYRAFRFPKPKKD